MADIKESPQPSKSRFTEPSEEVQKRNRTTGYIFLFIVLGLMAMAMIVRVYGS